MLVGQKEIELTKQGGLQKKDAAIIVEVQCKGTNERGVGKRSEGIVPNHN